MTGTVHEDYEPQPITRIEVFSFEQAAIFAGRGFTAEHRLRGNRKFMVAPTPKPALSIMGTTEPVPMMLKDQAE